MATMTKPKRNDGAVHVAFTSKDDGVAPAFMTSYKTTPEELKAWLTKRVNKDTAEREAAKTASGQIDETA